MRLLDLDPEWVKEKKREGVGLSFRCPHCEVRLVLWFSNPLDEKPIAEPVPYSNLRWHRTGSTFDKLSLTPAVNAVERDDLTGAHIEHWHGLIVEGEMCAIQ